MTAHLGRFTLRDLNPWEGPGLFALTGDINVMRYMGVRVHRSVDEAMQLIREYRDSPSRFQAITLRDSPNDILGVLGLEVQGHQASMTIMLRRDWKARGIARELCVPFVQWIFTHENIWRVWAYCHVDNVPVQRVLERMDASCEGLLRRFAMFPNVGTEPQDAFIYSIVR